MTGIGENTLAQPVKPPLRERRACLAKLVKNRLTLTAPWVASVSARAGEVFEQAEDSALAFTAFPRAHWAKLRTNNVQERANREIKRRYRVVQSFPSRESMLRLTCASLMETEGQWSQQRVFSEASAAEGFAEPADRPAPTEGRRRALGRRAREIVDEIVERRGLKKE